MILDVQFIYTKRTVHSTKQLNNNFFVNGNYFRYPEVGLSQLLFVAARQLDCAVLAPVRCLRLVVAAVRRNGGVDCDARLSKRSRIASFAALMCALGVSTSSGLAC